MLVWQAARQASVKIYTISYSNFSSSICAMYTTYSTNSSSTSLLRQFACEGRNFACKRKNKKNYGVTGALFSCFQNKYFILNTCIYIDCNVLQENGNRFGSLLYSE